MAVRLHRRRGRRPRFSNILDSRGIERVVLVGNSLGGAAAMVLATEHPERVAALVLVAPATPEAPIVWPVRLMRTRGVGELALALANRPTVAYGLRHRLFARGGRVAEQAIDDAWLPLTVPGDPAGGARGDSVEPGGLPRPGEPCPCSDAHSVGPRGQAHSRSRGRAPRPKDPGLAFAGFARGRSPAPARAARGVQPRRGGVPGASWRTLE